MRRNKLDEPLEKRLTLIENSSIGKLTLSEFQDGLEFPINDLYMSGGGNFDTDGLKKHGQMDV